MTSDANLQPTVAVLGLGAMGSALACAFLKAGHPTVVWNRTPTRTEPLVDDGATAASTVNEAVAPAHLVVLCLLDARAVLDVLAQTSEMDGRTVADLTSVTPTEADEIHQAISARGGVPVTGAVMATPPMIGTADALILYSGDRDAFDHHRSTLSALSGQADWVGADPGAAALLDLAMLDLFYGAVTAYVHAAALAATGGRSAEEFLPYAQSMLDLAAATAAELTGDLDRGEFPGDENNLAMMLRGIEHVVEAAEATGLDSSVPAVTRQLMHAAVDSGHGADGYGRIVENLTQLPTGAPRPQRLRA
jgi:3-hydroxyisobutyrate dehydrogenase-like beta-hydroxyacid dehydrogenase